MTPDGAVDGQQMSQQESSAPAIGTRTTEGLAVYVHIPFCAQRCSYCDFNTYAGLHEIIPRYIEALIQEIEEVAAARAASCSGPPHAVSAYFGGGTPSQLTPAQLGRALDAIRRVFTIDDGMEISLEANPADCSRDTLHAIRSLGFNRISIGAQSFRNDELALLGRRHDSQQIRLAIEAARSAGFQNVSLDLIYGLPAASLSAWQSTLDEALTLQPDHLSLYSLTIESGTALAHHVAMGELPKPDDDLAADMALYAAERLNEHGYVHYEIGNWARDDEAGEGRPIPARACRHNLQYWWNLPYLGLGAGAHGYADGTRYVNARHPADYIRRLQTAKQQPPPRSALAVERHLVTREEAMSNSMILGLRLLSTGVSKTAFYARFGATPRQAFAAELKRLIEEGQIVEDGDWLRLSEDAWLIGNRIFQSFLGEP